MKVIIVASKNPVKINAVKNGFERIFKGETFEISSVSVPSGVSDQPMTDEETYQGALNRLENAVHEIKIADFWVGIEGGLEKKNDELRAFAWVIIRSKEGKYGKGKSSTFFLPRKISDLIIIQGKELGQASDEVFNEHNSKQNQGVIGLLTNNLIDRTQYYTEPVIEALIPFIHPNLY
jgi:inosine/xanthosine triphosphatase